MGSFSHRILDVMEYFVSWNPGAHGIHDILKSMISWNPWSSGILESWNPWYIPNGNWLHVKAQWSYAVICLLIHHWAILEILDDNGKKIISDPIGCFIEWWHLKINSLFYIISIQHMIIYWLLDVFHLKSALHLPPYDHISYIIYDHIFEISFTFATRDWSLSVDLTQKPTHWCFFSLVHICQNHF